VHCELRHASDLCDSVGPLNPQIASKLDVTLLDREPLILHVRRYSMLLEQHQQLCFLTSAWRKCTGPKGLAQP
jgi:hypothetical protein